MKVRKEFKYIIMISSMFDVIGQAITAFTGALVNAFSGITTIFYTPGEGSAAGEWTVLGTLLLVAVGCGLVYLAYNVIRSLVRSAN